MAKKRRGESGRSRNQRRQHDARERTYEQHTEMAWHESKPLRYAMVAIVVIAILALTGLFVAGVIKF